MLRFSQSLAKNRKFAKSVDYEQFLFFLGPSIITDPRHANDHERDRRCETGEALPLLNLKKKKRKGTFLNRFNFPT